MTLSVADRLEILDVVTQADQAATDRDAAAYVQLFTTDAVRDRAPAWAAEGPATFHLTLNPLIEDLDDDRGRRAAVRSILLIITPGPPPAIRAAMAVTQILVRRNGSWRIDRRTVGVPGPRPAFRLASFGS
jgi:hypothetical protein